MPEAGSFLHNRNLWVYYILFFSGSLALIYQAFGWAVLGDSVTFLCLLFLINGLLARQLLHILENSLLMTLGYILPLLIRNSIKFTHKEDPSIQEFMNLAAISTGTTLLLGFCFTFLGFILHLFGRKIRHLGRSRITSSSTFLEK